MRMVSIDRPVLTLLGIGALALAAAGMSALLAADDTKADAGAKTSQLVKDMMGTWIRAGTPDKIEDPPPNNRHLKFLMGKHWTFTQADPDTGKVVYHHGGTYTLDGDDYTETINYANENTADLIGQTFKYKLKVDGDTLTQTGIGNPYTEVWKRAK
jgi:hypothetical protein